MTSPSLVTVLLLGALVSLGPMALASPPDQIWIGGVFDGADFDDVVAIVTSSEGATADAAPPTGKIAWSIVGTMPSAASSVEAGRSAPVFQGRAPPSV